MKSRVSVFWFRRDLRLKDNVGLYKAASAEYPILPVFIFDPDILTNFEDSFDRRVDYIHQSLTALHEELKNSGSGILTFVGKPTEVFSLLLNKYDVKFVFCNRDYEPYAIQRDTLIYNMCNENGIAFRACKDQVIFDKNDILKQDKSPYTIFTPYAHAWKARLQPSDYSPIDSVALNWFQYPPPKMPDLTEIGFEKTDLTASKPDIDFELIRNYAANKNFPAQRGTTHLGMALRFGTISIRECVSAAVARSESWLNELIWREFFMQILYHFPNVTFQAFKKKYDRIQWRNNESEFSTWCEGKTGFPLVDAGMRELNRTGFMHNRVRMVVASFLTKHLLIDWRWGEAYFAQKLNDFDLSANNGNWQWAAGCGCDAAPYFRVFNPMLQADKFDKTRAYIRKWVPEYLTDHYPAPMVDHAFARLRAIAVFKQALT